MLTGDSISCLTASNALDCVEARAEPGCDRRNNFRFWHETHLPGRSFARRGKKISAGRAKKQGAPNDAGLAPILKREFDSALADKSTFASQRNLTVATLELPDGSIAVETKAEARSTQPSSSVGVGHA